MTQRTRRRRNGNANDASVKQPGISPYAGKPLDGSQYVDVVEEQEYADQRPTAEEQRPRFSYMKEPPAQPAKK
ncbi:hypothetical protein EGT07_25975 [Herbaspirillum sp. HC18]|nr:hypothetical protein EGT07_25975 [Herbaspirillum sp. HC18]